MLTIAGIRNRTKSSSPRITAGLISDRGCSRPGDSEDRSALPTPVAAIGLDTRPGDRDHALSVGDQQRDRREHERRQVVVVGEALIRARLDRRIDDADIPGDLLAGGGADREEITRNVSVVVSSATRS